MRPERRNNSKPKENRPKKVLSQKITVLKTSMKTTVRFSKKSRTNSMLAPKKTKTRFNKKKSPLRLNSRNRNKNSKWNKSNPPNDYSKTYFYINQNIYDNIFYFNGFFIKLAIPTSMVYSSVSSSSSDIIIVPADRP